MKQVDYKLFFIIFPLIIFWMIMISSVSVYSSFRVTSIMAENWLIEAAYNHFYVVRNIVHVIISLFLLYFISKVPYLFFEKNAKYFLWISWLLLFLVLIIWPSWNWARGWINLPFLPFAIQPTEFLKFSLVIFFAAYLKANKHKVKSFKEWLLPYFWIFWIFFILIWLQPDFWTIMVTVPVSVIMFFIAWWNVKQLFLLWFLWFLFSLTIYWSWKYDKNFPEERNKFSYITDRIDNFLSDNKKSIEDKTINYQTKQALIAIWSWWFTWLWFWQSIQKYWYLPETQGDFIFSVIVEELWFIWAFVLVLMYLWIWYRWFSLAYYSTDLFIRLTAVWITSRILVQAFINMWVNLNIVPLTWITLPFISYWWSSLLSLMLWVWLLLSMSRSVDEQKNSSIRSRTDFSRNQIMY